MKSARKWLSLMVCTVLIGAMALGISGCNSNVTVPEQATFTDGQSLGQGAAQFTLQVVDLDGSTATAQVSTDKETVGEALQALGLIGGVKEQYGLYIKTVNGITYDYNQDGVYWGFYIDGEYALTGVDTTRITPGSTYTLKAETI